MDTAVHRTLLRLVVLVYTNHFYRDRDNEVFTRLLTTTEKMRELLFEKFPAALNKASETLRQFNETIQDAKQKHDQAFAIALHVTRYILLPKTF